MIWPLSRKATPATAEKKYAGVMLASRMTAPPAFSYDRMAAEGYGQNPVVRACVDRIAGSVAAVEPALYRRTRDGVAKIDPLSEPEKSPAMALLKLLDRPNAMQSGKEFLRHLAAYYALAGNAFVFGNGLERRQRVPAELQLFCPKHVTLKAGRGMPAAYVYTPTGGERYEYPVDQVSGDSAVLHLKAFNPLSPWYGLAPLEAAALAVDQHNAGSAWNYSLLKNGAKPDGALVVKGRDGEAGTLTDDQYSRLKAMIGEQYAGASNAGRPMLLEGGLEWQAMSMNARDADFLNGKHAAAADIGLAFGVPPQLLGIPGSLTYANMEQATLAFWTDTVIPALSLILEGFNRWLTPRYGDDLFLWYDAEMIDALEPVRRSKSDRVNAAGFMAVNEKREAMGLDTTDGGDTVFVPSGLVPLDLAGEVTPPDPESSLGEGE